jgi:hypothetical protein
MELLKDILINLLSDAIWAAGAVIVARILLKKNDHSSLVLLKKITISKLIVYFPYQKSVHSKMVLHLPMLLFPALMITLMIAGVR